MQHSRAAQWLLGLKVVLTLTVVFLCASTFSALVQLSWNKDRYPQLSYPAPYFYPEVNWLAERPKEWVPLSAMPRSAWLSIIAAEDGGFFKHNGVEWEQSLAKVRSDLSKREFPGGVSTLNQQIAKNLYFGARPAFARKLQEIIVARRMDRELGKQRILETYMNIAEWGPGVVGIGAAARYYFRKPVSRLTEYESALLANLLPNPRVRGTWVRSGRLPHKFSRRVSRTMRRLAATARIVRIQQRALRAPAAQ